jgi:hypothetical protein
MCAIDGLTISAFINVENTFNIKDCYGPPTIGSKKKLLAGL